MQITFWQLGWRSLWRDVRAGEMRLLLLAVTLAVATLSAVGFFADRLQGGLQRDARQLLGGDAVVASDTPPAVAFAEQAQAWGLQAALTLSFPTMARAPEALGGASRLVALKAVQPGYPLRGRLQVREQPEGPVQTTADIPTRGEVWVDAAVLESLGLQPGDALLLGEQSLRITRVIEVEPDRGAGFLNFAPRVLMAESDLAATGLVQPASRISYRLAVAGEGRAVRRYIDWAEQHIDQQGLRGLRVESLQSGRPEMGQTLARAEKFLNLVALLAALLSAVAVALAARGFAANHLDDCAMLRVLGLPQRTMACSYTLEFVLAGLAASVLGVLLGYAVHHGFVLLLAGLVQAQLPAPSLRPVGVGLGMGLTLLVAFGLPPVLQLARVPALRVIRRDVGQVRPLSVVVLGLGLSGFAALLWVLSSDRMLALIAVGGFAVAVMLFALCSWVAVRLLRRLVNEARAPRWLVLATRQVSARPAYAVLQVSSLAVGLLALVLLLLLRTDLVSGWRQATVAEAPNRFVINVQPEQSEAFQQALREAGVAGYDWFPMIRGRLVAINGRDVRPEDYAEDRARRLLDREFNLSHSAQLPAQSPVSAGRWQPEESGAISMEEGIAKTLGLRLGDRLRFDMAGVAQESTITSLRKVDWGSMRANFFVIYPVSRMPDLPLTYMTAFRAPPQRGFDHALVRQFPNVTVVDMSATLLQVQRVLDQVIAAVEFLFAFTLAAGLLVVLASLSVTREERTREFAIMRAVGASAALLRQVQQAELLGVGLLAGTLASCVALVISAVLARFVFEFAWTLTPLIPLAGAMAGALLSLGVGWWSLRGVLQRPVVDTLRRAAS